MPWDFGKRNGGLKFLLLQKQGGSSRMVIDRKSITITKEVH